MCEIGCVFELKNVDKYGYMTYHSTPNCKGCPKRCFPASEKKKTFRRHVHQYLRKANTTRRLSAEGKAVYARWKEVSQMPNKTMDLGGHYTEGRRKTRITTGYFVLRKTSSEYGGSFLPPLRFNVPVFAKDFTT